jgi:hypothetical protein
MVERSYIRELPAFTRAEPEPIHLEDLEQELYVAGSDRATAIMLGSFVETNLERLLLSRMRADLNSKDRRQLFEYEGAAGTFSRIRPNERGPMRLALAAARSVFE